MKEQTDHGRGYEICPSSDILREDRRRAWGRDKRQAFDEALAAYEAQTGPFLHFAEPKEQPTVSWIRQRAEAVAAHSRRAGKRPPVVFIDYLQLLASPDPHMSDKQAMDSNVMALRQLARDLHMCVVAISALNRASYSTGITMESFRESSSIEYSADLLLGLQPEGMGERMAAVAESKRMGEARQELARFKQQAVRECELVVLKNRNGKIPRPIPLKCYAACSDFESVSRPAASSARVR
jgi:replicative DNA helicase